MSSIESFAAETKAASEAPKTISPFVKAARLLLFVSVMALSQPALRRKGTACISDYASLRSLFVKNQNQLQPSSNRAATVGASSMVVGNSKPVFSEASGSSVSGVKTVEAAQQVEPKSDEVLNSMESLIIDTWVEDLRRRKML